MKGREREDHLFFALLLFSGNCLTIHWKDFWINKKVNFISFIIYDRYQIWPIVIISQCTCSLYTFIILWQYIVIYDHIWPLSYMTIITLKQREEWVALSAPPAQLFQQMPEVPAPYHHHHQHHNIHHHIQTFQHHWSSPSSLIHWTDARDTCSISSSAPSSSL